MTPDDIALDVIRRLLTEKVARYEGHDIAATTEYVLTCYGMVLLTRLDAATERERVLREALQRYGVHEHYTCELQEVCDCGLDAALAPTTPKERAEQGD